MLSILYCYGDIFDLTKSWERKKIRKTYRDGHMEEGQIIKGMPVLDSTNTDKNKQKEAISPSYDTICLKQFIY